MRWIVVGVLICVGFTLGSEITHGVVNLYSTVKVPLNEQTVSIGIIVILSGLALYEKSTEYE